MTPDEWSEAWEHRILNARSDDQLLPAEAREFLVSNGMPNVVIFEWSSSFEISFLPLAKNLVDYNALVCWGDDRNETLESEWQNQIVIADEDFCNGSASHCVHRETGIVSRIDCELPKPQCFINSSVAQFGKSLLIAKRWSAALKARGIKPTAESFDVLARELRMVDANTFDTADHYWRNLVEYFLESILDEIDFDLEITDDPARSKPRF